MGAPALSVVVPAFNEFGRIAGNLRILRAAFPDAEIVVSDDGSTDATAAEAEALGDPGVRVLRNPHKGRGAALKAGLAAAGGDIVVTVDADLSYGPEEVRRLFDHLRKYPACDLVIGSCYMPGGRTEGVPAGRLWVSRVGNLLLRFAFHGRFHTTTGILRGYRRERLQAILPTLVSDGKELYLEFLHKALATGWQVEEVPATLVWRRPGEGRDGFPFAVTAHSHLTFALARRREFFLLLSLALSIPLLGVSSLVALDNHIPWLREMLGSDWFSGRRLTVILFSSAYMVLGILLAGSASDARRIWEGRIGPILSPLLDGGIREERPRRNISPFKAAMWAGTETLLWLLPFLL